MFGIRRIKPGFSPAYKSLSKDGLLLRRIVRRVKYPNDPCPCGSGKKYKKCCGRTTATLVIIKVVNIINDMYIPYLYMPKNSLKTLTTFLMSFAGAQTGSWQRLSAGIIIVLIPTTSGVQPDGNGTKPQTGSAEFGGLGTNV